MKNEVDGVSNDLQAVYGFPRRRSCTQQLAGDLVGHLQAGVLVADVEATSPKSRRRTATRRILTPRGKPPEPAR